MSDFGELTEFVEIDGLGLGASTVVVDLSTVAAASAYDVLDRFLDPALDPLSSPVILPHLELAIGRVDISRFASLRNDGFSLYSSPSGIEPITEVANEQLGAAEVESMNWGIQALEIPALWEKGLLGSGVRVAHLDTGVDASHVALSGKIVAFAEFDKFGLSVNPAVVRDSGRHGTHTAGTICGRNIGPNVIGIAPDAELASAIVIEGGDILKRILQGLEWVIASSGARIVNVSVGVRGYSPFWNEVVSRVARKGLIPIVAIGNEGPGSSRSPGNYYEVLSVGAIADDLSVASFSSSEELREPHQNLPRNEPDVVAPGHQIVSCNVGGGYRTTSGTSMATPFVSGVVALLAQAKPLATSTEIVSAIKDTAKKLDTQSQVRQGLGLIQPRAALERLLNGGG